MADIQLDPDWEKHRDELTVDAEGYVRLGTNRLARLVMGCVRGDGVRVDHVSGDKLDNRRSNLRRTDQSGNGLNRAAVRPRGPRGVSWDSTQGKWDARVKVRGRTHWAGRHDTQEAAVEAVTALRKKLGVPSYAGA